MSYNKEEYSSTTMTSITPGFGILCTEGSILCDSEKYDCVGAVVMKSRVTSATTIATNITTVNASLSNFGVSWYNAEVYL